MKHVSVRYRRNSSTCPFCLALAGIAGCATVLGIDPPEPGGDASEVGAGDDAGVDGARWNDADADTSTAGGSAGDGGAGGSAGDAATSSCAGKPNFTRCHVVTTPDRDYDICIQGECLSTGCGTVTCNVPGPWFRLADTGQRDCFDQAGKVACADSAGAPACASIPGCGQDAQYGWDKAHPAQDRFVRVEAAPGEWVVRDDVTGLMWQGCHAGKSGSDCQGDAESLTWEDALARCDGLVWGGSDDWRLPDEYEAQSLVDYGSESVAIDTWVFPSADSAHGEWTSSTAVGAGAFAWFVDYAEGIVAGWSPKSSTKAARCVRSAAAAGALPRFDIDLTMLSQPVVIDRLTGLKWQGCVAGVEGTGCTKGTALVLSFNEALQHCETSTWGGIDSWRVPSVTEAFSSTRHAKGWPALDASVFPGVPDNTFIRTSTTVRKDPSSAWLLSVHDGAITAGLMAETKTAPLLVRCVSN